MLLLNKLYVKYRVVGRVLGVIINLHAMLGERGFIVVLLLIFFFLCFWIFKSHYLFNLEEPAF